MSSTIMTREGNTFIKTEVKIKQKRKNAHPVRKYFTQVGGTQHKCSFCAWNTVENATRMVQHIVNRCKEAPEDVREEISAAMIVAEERLQQSYVTSHNKKDIHNYFQAIDNNRKRECMFCKWTTVLNLTRMRNHIAQSCHFVPPEVQQSFLKQEYLENSQCDTYCIINVDDGDRKGLQLVSSSSLDPSSGQESMDEVVIETEEYVLKSEADSYYKENAMDTITMDDPREGPSNQADNQTELLTLVGDDESERDEEVVIPETEDLEYVNVPEGRYFPLSKSVTDKQPLASTMEEESDERKTKRRADRKTVSVSRTYQQKHLSKEEQIRKLRTRFKSSDVSQPLRQTATVQTVIVKKEPEKHSASKKSPLSAKDEKHSIEKPGLQKTQNTSTVQTPPPRVKRPMANSTPFPNTNLRQVRVVLFFIRQ